MIGHYENKATGPPVRPPRHVCYRCGQEMTARALLSSDDDGPIVEYLVGPCRCQGRKKKPEEP